MSRLYEKLCMFRYAGVRPRDPGLPANGHIGWQLFTPHTIEQYFAGEPVWARRFVVSLKRGAVGVLMTQGTEWASFAWISTPGSARPPHIPRQLERDAYWIHHGHTKGRFRRRGLFKIVLARTLTEVYDRDPSPEILTDAAVGNVGSRRAIADVGFAEYGTLEVYYWWVPKVTRRPLFYSWRCSAPHPRMRHDVRRGARNC
jgi:hypothetical protein